MKRWSKLIAVAVLVLGLVNVGIGAAFIGIGVDKHSYLKSTMDEEKITLGIPDEKIAAGEVIDTMNEAQVAGDIVRSHRHEIAPTYGDLLGGGRYDPTNPTHLSYAQAMNIENYLYLATASFGITYLSMGAGAALLLVGIALMAVGVVVYKWAKRVYADKAEATAAVATAAS
jgi:hypothetical protein